MKNKRTKIIAISAIVTIAIAATIALIVFFAVANNSQYVVSFDLNGGEMSVSEITVDLNEEYSLPFPTKVGYQFKGWYDGEMLFPAMGTWTIEKNLKLKAMWEIVDESGFVYDEIVGGYKVIGYKGLVKERIVVPDTYNGKLVLSVEKDAFVDLKEYLDDGTIKSLLIYIPLRFDETCNNIAFDTRVEVARYNDMDDSGFSYEKQEDGYVMKEYVGEIMDNIIIPKEHKGLPVVSVRKNAWNALNALIEKNDNIKQVNIYVPDSVVNLLSDGAVVGKLRVIRYSDIDDGGIVYLNSKDTVSVVGYVGEYKNAITIPITHNGAEVTRIGSYAFYGTEYFLDKSLTSPFVVNIPESVKTIANNAFSSCYRVQVSVHFNSGVTKPRRVYDWLLAAEIGDANDELVEVICNFRSFFGGALNPRAQCYVRYEPKGGKVIQYLETGKDENNVPILVPVVVFDAPCYTLNLPYKLPVPIREGYKFEGWYYGEEPVAQEGERWTYTKYITIEAKWSEIEKEGE